MPINSKLKGAKFERKVAAMLKDHGFDARRGQQYCGANGDADVVGLPGIHIEAKKKEKIQNSFYTGHSDGLLPDLCMPFVSVRRAMVCKHLRKNRL